MHQLNSPLPTSSKAAEQRQALDDRADMGNSMKPGGLFTNMATGSPDLNFRMIPHSTPAWIGIEELQEPLRPSKISRIRSRTLSVLRMLTNSTSSTSQAESPPSVPPVFPNPPTPPLSPKTIIHSPIQCPSGLFKKKSYFRLPPALEPTVVHRTKFKSRPSIISNDGAVHEVTQIPSPSSTSTGDSSTNSGKSGKSSGEPRPSQSTGKTSVESKLSNKTKNRSPRSSENKKVTASPKQLAPERRSIEGGYLLLTPIAEVEAQPAPVLVPTYITVEKAAATKAFLECHYNSLTCGQVSPRSVRRRKLECQLYENGDDLAEMERRRQDWATRETDHLRELRVMKIRGANALKGKCQPASMYEVVKILGKGSFGVVRLVRERPENDACQDPQKPKEVYAMKVIRKSDMLRNSQEAHLRAERDFLVAAENSKWVVPLIASFQDVNNLYLVMDYMPGGDFLGLLIRDNVLSEHDTKFYIAEMILCVEEAHSLQWIHRDVKPDNFLITASGHLKISDFGLAFDGHWSHDQAYYNNHRQSLLNKLGITIEGDSLDRKEGQKIADAMKTAQTTTIGQNRHEFKSSSIEETEGILNWRNRHGNRAVARSVVGTSQYMAPEVVRGDSYDARCDWWSVAIILYECLYGHTPFLAEEGGRQQTKVNIVNHRDTFIIPNRPVVSNHCKDLMRRILVEKEERLCCPEYTHGSSFRVSGPCRDYAGRFVYDKDARDIKAHKWFRGIDWAHLHEQQPPFVPNIKTKEDTHYFDEEESISDFSPSVPDKEPDVKEIEDCLRAFNREIKILATSFIERPYDSARLRKVEKEIDRFAMNDHEKEYLKRFVKHYGKKEKKRPRDRLLRDKETAGKAMEIRKKNAFLGYTYRRVGVEKSIGRCSDFAVSSYKRKVWHRAALSM